MQVKLHAFFVFFFSPPHRFCVSLSPRRKDEDTQKSNFNRKIVNRKIVNITMILFFINFHPMGIKTVMQTVAFLSADQETIL